MQRLLVLALFIIITYAAESKPDSAVKSSIFGISDYTYTPFSDHVELQLNTTVCQVPKCSCEYTIDNKEDTSPHSLEFLKDKDYSATVKLSNLQPNTKYSVVISCTADINVVTTKISITTDSGAPSEPENITVDLSKDHILVTWSPPSKPGGVIDHYEISIDGSAPVSEAAKAKNSYIFSEKYEYGTKHDISLVACNKNKQGVALCSGPVVIPFKVEQSTTTTTPTPTTSTSFAIHSYSISISLIIFSLFVKMNF